MYQIKAFEGARGTSHRLRPIYNTIVLDGPDRYETTYGWEGTEYVSPKDPTQAIVFWDVMDGANRSYQNVVIILPDGRVYKSCKDRQDKDYWVLDDRATLGPIPKKVVELSRGLYPTDTTPKPCKYLNDNCYTTSYTTLRCAVHPLSTTCHQCPNYEVVSTPAREVENA
jgi:hypothetical protein